MFLNAKNYVFSDKVTQYYLIFMHKVGIKSKFVWIRGKRVHADKHT
jgi:hypothetical protein